MLTRVFLLSVFVAHTVWAGNFGADVYQLTDSNFDDHVLDGSVWIVDFYAPWCGHCKKLIPEWSTLATSIKGTAKAGSLDATSHKAATNKYGVSGYPSIKLFLENGNRIVDFKGIRDAEHIESFVHKMLRPAVDTLTSDADLDKFVADHDVAFVMVGDQDSAPALKEAFLNASVYWQADQHFAEIQAKPASLPAELELPAVLAYSNKELRESMPPNTNTSAQMEDMATFMNDNHIGLCSQLGQGTFFRTTHSGRITVAAVVDPYNDARTTDVKAELKEMARHSKKYRYGWIDGVKWPEFCDNVGVSPSDFPVLMVIDAPNKIHYVHRNASWSHAEFIAAFEEGLVPAEGDGASWLYFLTPGPTGMMIAVGIMLTIMTLIFGMADPVPVSTPKKTN